MKHALTFLLLITLGSTAAAEDAALKAVPLNFNPGAKYADNARIFQGIPGLERAANGRLWVTWYAGGPGEGPENYVTLVTSGDDGKTWSKIQFVIDPADDVRAFDPCLWTDPEGRLWLFWAQGFSHYDGRAGVWCVVTENPGDAKPTWSEPRRICDGIMMNKPTVLSDGTWMLPVAVWQMGPNKHLPSEKAFDDPETRGSRVVCSKDQGKMFELIGMAQLKEAACDEHMIVEKKDRTLWMLIRTRYGIGESSSTDGGKTWSAGKKYFVEHPTARFFIRRLNSGNLLLVKHGPIDKRTGRSHLTAFVSKDDGKSWEGGLLLDERNSVSYPDGVEAADGTIYIVYDISRTGDKEILVATFTEADAAAGKAVSDKVRLRIIANKATGVRPEKKPVKIDYKDNQDGKPLLKDAAAGIKPLFGKEQAFAKKAMLFTNRKYRVHDLPKVLAGKRFVQSSIDFVKAECTQDGIVYVLTPSKGRNRDSLVDALTQKGFEKAVVPEFMLFGNIPGNVCSVYQKKLKKGEKLELGKWGVLVY